ncbi:MAG: hypothetical protein C0501_06405 [Isosphaera sp.]|nr:hypothetical protein [Isosphaera sp.]
MFSISLALSGVLLLAAVLAARYAKHPVGTTIGWAAGVTFLPLCTLTIGLTAVWYQAAFLVAGLWVAAALGYSRRAVPPVAVGSFLVAYAILGVSLVGKEREYARLRAAYPFESMEARLPRPAPPSAPSDSARLERWEQEVGDNTWGRHRHLATLHEDTTRRFVNSAGFGVARMARVEPTEETLDPGPRPDVPQESDYFNPGLAAGPQAGAGRPDPVALGKLHDAGFLDFVNPRGFGYVRDRRHVAGFQPHEFTRVPGPAERWAVARLELVGLLRHDDPVVYVSASLPRMDALRDAPTRPTDPFETAALAALRAGADLHVGDGPDTGRFVGAVRSTRQCLECHGGDRGALLGAFTYRLRPAR